MYSPFRENVSIHYDRTYFKKYNANELYCRKKLGKYVKEVHRVQITLEIDASSRQKSVA